MRNFMRGGGEGGNIMQGGGEGGNTLSPVAEALTGEALTGRGLS